MKKVVRTWSLQDREYLYQNIGKTPIEEICKYLKRNENSVKLFLHRNRTNPKTIINDNALIRILTAKYGDPSLFTPNKDFYTKVKIGQRRFWQLYKGICKMSDDECYQICKIIGLDYQQYLESIQTKLF